MSIEEIKELVDKVYKEDRLNFEKNEADSYKQKIKKICFSQHGGCANCKLADHKNKVCNGEILKSLLYNIK